LDLNACRKPQREPYRLLARRGFEVLLLAPEAWREPFGLAPFEAEADLPHYQARPLPLAFNGRYHRVLFRGLERVVRDFRPDQIWAHAEPENWLAWQTARARDRYCPAARLTLVSWRNIDYPREGLPYKLPGLHQRLEDRARWDADQVLCYNQDAERILGSLGFQTAPTRMGVNLGVFGPGSQAEARRALGLPKGKLAGFAGRFIEPKGVADLIDAAAKVPGLSLLLLGGGPSQAAWEARAQAAGVPLQIRALEHSQMVQGLRALDALVLPSRSTTGWLEQFGRILIEAMACGIPVIGSDSGAIPEVIGRAGLVFPEGDVAALAVALRRALKASAPLRRAGLTRARHYEWKAIAPDLAAGFSTAPGLPSVPVQGLPIFAGDRAAVLTAVEGLLKQGRGGSVLYANAHVANLAASDPELRRCLRHADLVLPDGGGILMAARWAGQRLPEQLALGDLLGPLARLGQRRRAGVFFWGGEAGVAEAAAQALGLRLAGASHGFQRDEAEMKAVIAAIRRSRASLVFVGFGSPKQERLIQRLRAELPKAVLVACGNAFTFAAGRQRRAPAWMRRNSLEWLWRLGLEPGRLWQRYLLGNLRFVGRSLWELRPWA
jgi:N-acetylglucosaminyldiphosphoundecaprenol N-acetyl-beta-D-mannosaminyltransferase